MTLQARYTILRKIADGGTAEIFLATQHGAHGFEKPVVLKRIFPAFYADPQFRNMLIDEAHIAMSLNHSSIVQVLDLGEADGQYVLALELVDGWTLDAVLRRARALKTSIPPALALYMTAEVCRALAYAHAKVDAEEKPLGIIHRDISPHNLLLSAQGEVKLTDFGIAKARNRRESSLGNIIKGKIAYMSPEQASGTELDARSDLFSVGTMLYVMVCRRYPFDAPTDLEVLLLVKNGAYQAPEEAQPGLNPEIYRVIKRAMAKSPDDRYQRAEEMLIDVEQVMRVAFRAVGQTELKRWLQDLSMRDGVPPLTRTPAPPASGGGGRLEGETLELRGVGTTSPPVTLPPPNLQAARSAPIGPRGGGAGAGPGGQGRPVRPPPPPAAMAVGKTGNNPAPKAGHQEPRGASGPISSGAASIAGAGPSAAAPGAEAGALPAAASAVPRLAPAGTSVRSKSVAAGNTTTATQQVRGEENERAEPAEPENTPTPASQTRKSAPVGPSLPLGTPQPTGAARADERQAPRERRGRARKTGSQAAAEPRTGGEQPPSHPASSEHLGSPAAVPLALPDRPEAGSATEKNLRKSGSFDLPVSPRKSSSWVAEAVLASAQRAGTTPAPPVGSSVPPPPVAGLDSPERREPAPSPVVVAPEIPAPAKRRGLLVGSGIGLAAVLIVGLSIRACGGDSSETLANRAPSGGEQASPTRPTSPAPAPRPPVSTLAAPDPSGAASPAGTAPAPAAPRPAPALPTAGAGPAPVAVTSPGGDAGAERSRNSRTVPVAVAPGGERPAASAGRARGAATAGSGAGTGKSVDSGIASASAPGASTATPSSSADVRAVGGGAIAPAAPDSPPVALAPGPPSSSSGLAGDNDADQPEPGNSAAPAPKVMVLLSSTPPGAQVGTGRRTFGATPVSVKLKVGRTYALVFSREGYRPVTKQFRVGKFSDQQVSAVLRPEQAPAKAPVAPAGDPPPKPRTWIQRMFAR